MSLDHDSVKINTYKTISVKESLYKQSSPVVLETKKFKMDDNNILDRLGTQNDDDENIVRDIFTNPKIANTV